MVMKPKLKANTLPFQCFQILKKHVGKGRSISNELLARKLGVNTREVRLTIKTLRLNGFNIGSSRSEPTGYYLPSTPEEMKECLAEFEKQWHTSLTVWARLRRMTMAAIIKKVQLEIKLK
jgi:biotin operon repressor